MMATKNFAKALNAAKSMGRYEGMAAFVEVAIVAIHNICVERGIYGKWERELIADFEPEIKDILQIKEYMSAEDIGDLVVGHAERLRKEAAKARGNSNER